MPFQSKAQQRLFYAKMEKGEMPEKTVKKWTKETKKQPGGFKDLPEKVESDSESSDHSSKDKKESKHKYNKKSASVIVGDRLRMKYVASDLQKYNQTTKYASSNLVPLELWHEQTAQKEASQNLTKSLLEKHNASFLGLRNE